MTESMQDYLKQEYSLHQPKRGEIIEVEVLRIGPEGLLVEMGAKVEGLVPLEDLTQLDPQYRESIQVGTRLSAYVLQTQGPERNAILSVNLARDEEEWREAERYLKTGELYEAEVSGFNKGGLIVPFGGIRGFVPASQILNLGGGDGPNSWEKRMAGLVGTTMAFKVIEVDRQKKRLILSQKAARRELRERKKEKLISQLKEGEVVRGYVSSLSDFGAFVDLGGADGLIHLSELSYQRVQHPQEILKAGQEVEVYVLKVDRERKRISLSLRRLQPDPWDTVEERFQVGQIVEGTVTKITDFGAFAHLEDGIEGLIHTSELGGYLVQEGERLTLKIISLDAQNRRIGLSLKRIPTDSGTGSGKPAATPEPPVVESNQEATSAQVTSPEAEGSSAALGSPPASSSTPEAGEETPAKKRTASKTKKNA